MMLGLRVLGRIRAEIQAEVETITTEITVEEGMLAFQEELVILGLNN